MSDLLFGNEEDKRHFFSWKLVLSSLPNVYVATQELKGVVNSSILTSQWPKSEKKKRT